ncbi:MAG TPA: hypothetical protein VFS97_08365 [Nitrososphaeraceae archaeon]|nr:hypothetical protein [Nitrososphaeraceae archaeon]
MSDNRITVTTFAPVIAASTVASVLGLTSSTHFNKRGYGHLIPKNYRTIISKLNSSRTIRQPNQFKQIDNIFY